MDSNKRCTRFPQSSDLSSEFQDIPIQDAGQKMSATKLQKRPKPARLPLPVKRAADDVSDSSNKRRPLFTCDGSPWGKYQKLQKESTKGKICLAFEKASPGNIVAIKEYMTSVDEISTRSLTKTSHTNLVNLLLLFVESESLYFVYERMDVTLEQLASAVKLKEPQIAFLCKEILQGLSYIHEGLHISHGDVKSDNIFLTLSGHVKLGNIAMSLFHQRKGNELHDVKALGKLMKEIMEPGDFKKNPDSAVLKEPVNWDDSIRTFMMATQKSTLRDLLNVRPPMLVECSC